MRASEKQDGGSEEEQRGRRQSNFQQGGFGFKHGGSKIFDTKGNFYPNIVFCGDKYTAPTLKSG